MSKLFLSVVLALAAAAVAALELESETGTIIYMPSCSSKYAFSYFDGARLQNLCIVDTPEVSLREFISESNVSQCGGVEVVHGTASEGQIRAREIRPEFGCNRDGDGKFPDR